MRGSAYFLLMSAATASFLCAAQDDPAELPAHGPVLPTYVISGVVVREGTNQPLKHVRVTIALNDHPDAQSTLATGEDGRFRFINVPRGKFTLSAQVHGTEQLYQQDGAFSTGIVTGPGFDSEHIVFSLPPATSLAVKVMDEEGDPVRNVQLFLIHKQVEDGWAQTVMRGQSNTDASGEAHFGHLQPGTYYLAASGHPWYAQGAVPDGPEIDPQQREQLTKMDVCYPITYYGDTSSASAATPIEMTTGATQRVEIHLRAVPAVHLELAQTGADQGIQNPQLMPVIQATGPGGVPLMVNASQYGVNNRIGVEVAPGQYLISGQRFVPGQAMNQAESVGSAEVNVSADARVELGHSAGATISGHFSMAGSGGEKPNGVWLLDPKNNRNAFSQIGADGALHFHANGFGGGGAILPGRYALGLNSNELYVRSVQAEGATFANGFLDIRQGANVTISVVAASGVTKVDGIALSEGKPVPGAMVLLVPADSATGLFVPRDQSDSDGTFTLQGVHPGHYLLLAIDKGHGLAYHDSALLKPYLTKGVPVTVPLISNARVSVEVQKRQ